MSDRKIFAAAMIFFSLIMIYMLAYGIAKIIGNLELTSNIGIFLIICLSLFFGFHLCKSELEKRHIRNFHARQKASFHVVQTKHGTAIRETSELAKWMFFGGNGNGNGMTTVGQSQAQIREPNIKTSIFDAINGMQRIFVWGGSGSGKTTFLSNLIQKLEGEKYICDPHSAPDDWHGAKVIGAGRNYKQVESFMSAMENELDARYQAREQGQKIFNPTWVIIDEMNLLVESVPNFMDSFRNILREGRKVQLNIVLSGQSKTAKSIGLKGQYDLMQSFDGVIETRKEHGRHVAILNEQDLCEIPRQIENHGLSQYENHAVIKRDNPVFTRESRRDCDRDRNELEVVRMHLEGYSLSKIATTVFGHKNGMTVGKVKEILSKQNQYNS